MPMADETGTGKRLAPLVGLFLGPLLLLLLLPAPAGLTPEAWAVAAVAALMVTWWITDALTPRPHVPSIAGRRDRHANHGNGRAFPVGSKAAEHCMAELSPTKRQPIDRILARSGRRLEFHKLPGAAHVSRTLVERD